MSEVTTDTPAETTPETATAPAAGAPSTVAPAAPTLKEAVETAKGAVVRAREAVEKFKAATERAESDAPDPVAHMLKSLQESLASAQADLKAERTARAKAERERDTHAQQVDVLTKRTAEGAIVARLRDLVPAGVPEIDLRGALGALHESGKVNRYGEDADAMAKAAFDALKAVNSSILRAAPPAGGPAGAPPQAKGPVVRRPPI